MRTRATTRLMRTYRTVLVGGALALLASGGTMLVHGGWQAVLAAVAEFAGAGSVTGLIALLAAGEGLASPAPRQAPRRAVARPAPAPETPPEPAPPREPARPTPRPRARLSSTPS